MKRNALPSIDKYDFAAAYKVERDPKIKIKLLALHHLQSGLSQVEVGKLVLVTEKTLRSWLDAFIQFDYEGLIERVGRGRKPRLPPEDEENFKESLDQLQESLKGGRITVAKIKDLLADGFDCNYSENGVYTLLDRLNIVWISGRSKHPKSNEEAIVAFKKSFPDEVKKIKKQIETDKVEVWWQDESRIGQQGSLTRQWAAKGTRPRVVRQRQFISTYIFGAICPKKDKGCALVLPETNTGMMQFHLNQISEHVEDGYHAIIMMDRASWHTTEALVIPKNVSILPLPPYSPELNPMEQVWQQLKKIRLSNTCFKNYEEIVDACCEAWNCFCDEEGNIENIGNRAWAQT